MNGNEKILDHAITKANEMVIGASFGIMEAETAAAKSQARYFQALFSGVRDVLQGALDGRDPSRSGAVMTLASAVVGVDVLDEVHS